MFKYSSLLERYIHSLDEKSDMRQYLPTLFEFGAKVKHITEFGVRAGVSTCAFLATRPKKMVAYDIKKFDGVDELIELSKKENINFIYKLESTLETTIEPTDLLFVDTLHDYEHIKKELELHAEKVSKYIIFHDVVQYGTRGGNGGVGIMPAIDEFLYNNKEWEILLMRFDIPGLMIIKNLEPPERVFIEF